MALGSRHLTVTSALVVLGVGCSPPQSAPRPETPAAAAEPTPATTAEPAPPAEPEHDDEPSAAARLREVVRRTLPDAQVNVLALDDDGTGWASIAWRSIRIRVEYREHARGVSLLEHQVLAAAAFLRELGDAGVTLARTGRWLATESGSALECASDPEADSPSFRCSAVSSAEAPSPSAPVTLEPQDWMLPPSQRARSRGSRPSARRDRPSSSSTTPPEAAQIAEVFGRHEALNVFGVPLDETHRMLLVTSDEFGDGPTGVLLCVANPNGAERSLDCASTNIEEVEGVVAASPERWLLVTESAYGNPRDNNRLLLSVQREEQGLIVDTLDLGGVAGEGHACEDRPGYCVDMEGVAHGGQIVAPDCVELRPGPRWHATHVRIGDRWIEERVEPAPSCAERYGIQEGVFIRADCGPTPTLPACPQPSAEDEEP